MKMKPMLIVGIVLCVLGLAMLIFHQKFTMKQEEKVGLGPINTTVTTNKEISPIWGGLVLAGGVVVVLVGMKK